MVITLDMVIFTFQTQLEQAILYLFKTMLETPMASVILKELRSLKVFIWLMFTMNLPWKCFNKGFNQKKRLIMRIKEEKRQPKEILEYQAKGKMSSNWKSLRKLWSLLIKEVFGNLLKLRGKIRKEKEFLVIMMTVLYISTQSQTCNSDHSTQQKMLLE